MTAVLIDYLLGIPVGWRFFIKHQIFDRLARQVAQEGDTPGVAMVERLLDELSQEHPAHKEAPGRPKLP